MTHSDIERRHLVDRYLLRKLPPEEEIAFAQHYIGCRHCLRELENSRKAIDNILRARGAAAPIPRTHRHRFLMLPLPVWGLAAALAGVGVFVSSSRPGAGPSPAAGPGPLVVTLETYRASAVGARLKAPPGGTFWMRLDRRGLAEFPLYSVSLVGENGETVWSGPGEPAPDPDFLQARVEAASVSPGVYWVRLAGQGPDAESPLLREYSMLVEP